MGLQAGSLVGSVCFRIRKQTPGGKGRRHSECRTMAAAQTPQDAAREAAIKGEFGKVYDGRRLRDPLQQLLVAYFAGRQGETVADIRQLLVVDKTDEQGWEALWESALAGAGVQGDFDRKLFLRWARARSSGGGGAVHGNAQAKRALDVLDSSGLAVSAELRADIEAALTKGEAGTEKEQCCCSLAVFILYLGRAPADEEDEWWNTQYNALGGREGGLIDITKLQSYVKSHAKTPESSLTLERSLKSERSEVRFTEWSIKTNDLLNKAGLFYAAARLMKVLTQANRQSGGAWPRKRVYLYGYFFEEFLGLGLPADYAVQSAFNSMAVNVPGTGPTKSDLGAAMSDSMLSNLGNLGDYSGLGGAGRSGGEAGNLVAVMSALQKSIEESLAPLKDLKVKGGGGGGESSSSFTCPFCRRKACTMSAGGRPCHEASRAAKLWNSQKKKGDEEKKGGDPKGEPSSQEEE